MVIRALLSHHILYQVLESVHTLPCLVFLLNLVLQLSPLSYCLIVLASQIGAGKCLDHREDDVASVCSLVITCLQDVEDDLAWDDKVKLIRVFQKDYISV